MPDHPKAAAKLQKAVRELYRVFGHYRGDPNWDDGLDNLPRERASRPERLAVKDLSWEDVEYFFWHAVTLGGPRQRQNDELNAIRYFLPRVFEFNSQALPVSKPHGTVCDWWFIGERMRNTSWHGWPAEQRKPIVSWFAAWLDAILFYEVATPAGHNRFGDCEPANRKPATWIEAVAELDLEMAGFIPKLESVDDRHLLDFAETLVRKRLFRPAAIGFFWETDDPARQQPLATWLLNKKTADQLEGTFFACNDPSLASRISMNLELLDGIKASVALPGTN